MPAGRAGAPTLSTEWSARRRAAIVRRKWRAVWSTMATRPLPARSGDLQARGRQASWPTRPTGRAMARVRQRQRENRFRWLRAASFGSDQALGDGMLREQIARLGAMAEALCKLGAVLADLAPPLVLPCQHSRDRRTDRFDRKRIEVVGKIARHLAEYR